MRYAIILAGGSGTRLWPMSRQEEPKQLIPLIGGKSLLQLAFERLEGLVEPKYRIVCAVESLRTMILERIKGLSDEQFFGEPTGRDTLAACAFSAAIISLRDPQARIAVLTADHIIEPVADFVRLVRRGYEIVERSPDLLLTFGVAPTHAATGYGYLELGGELEGGARLVKRFREKPDGGTAARYLEGGPERYLWNSGMFIWNAGIFLSCVERYEPEVYRGVFRIAEAWNTENKKRVLEEAYPAFKKISVDYAVMEPASLGGFVRVAALPMPISWRDIGSWAAYAQTRTRDEKGNSLSGGRGFFLESTGCLAVSSEPGHLIAVAGCEEMMVIHTPDVTLVCPKSRAEEIKRLHDLVRRSYGEQYI